MYVHSFYAPVSLRLPVDDPTVRVLDELRKKSDMAVNSHPAADHASVVDTGTQFIDVRQPDEVAAGSLPGAVNIPLDELPARIGELDPQRRTVLLCRSGTRSGRAAQYLVESGFTNVINLDGGMLAAEAGE